MNILRLKKMGMDFYEHQQYKQSYYTKDYLLKKINEISVIQYDAVEILN